MSPVSPVLHAVVTVRVGLKTELEWEHPFYRIWRARGPAHVNPPGWFDSKRRLLNELSCTIEKSENPAGFLADFPILQQKFWTLSM